MVARGGGFAEPLELRLNNERSPVRGDAKWIAPHGAAN
jgi:hypothetical protein